jgi:hypothetical protein
MMHAAAAHDLNAVEKVVALIGAHRDPARLGNRKITARHAQMGARCANRARRDLCGSAR